MNVQFCLAAGDEGHVLLYKTVLNSASSEYVMCTVYTYSVI